MIKENPQTPKSLDVGSFQVLLMRPPFLTSQTNDTCFLCKLYWHEFLNFFEFITVINCKCIVILKGLMKVLYAWDIDFEAAWILQFWMSINSDKLTLAFFKSSMNYIVISKMENRSGDVFLSDDISDWKWLRKLLITGYFHVLNFIILLHVLSVICMLLKCL